MLQMRVSTLNLFVQMRVSTLGLLVQIRVSTLGLLVQGVQSAASVEPGL